ncbi:MAG: hypothetical protein WAX77_15260 [Methylococcaceae bacterium]
MKNNKVFLATLEDIKQSTFLPSEQLQALQLKKLKLLLQRAIDYVPLYSQYYHQHVDLIKNLQSIDELWHLPAISKEDFINAGANNYIDSRRNLTNLIQVTTSGSLGKAMDLYATPFENLTRRGVFWAAWMWRINTSDRLFCMAAPHLDFKHQFVPNVFIPTLMPADEVRARFLEFQPTVLLGSVEAIALLARDLRQHNIVNQSVRNIFPFGQTLTPFLKAMIRESFNGDIFNLYGAMETNWIAYECEYHDGLHIPMDRNIVQIAKLNQPNQAAESGEVGEVIVTSLTRWTMPFIRYRLFDVASLDSSPCPCGRTTPRLKTIEGRVHDFLIAMSGHWVSPGAIATDLAHGRDAILDHRIVQETPTKVKVWIVPAAHFDDQERQHIVEVITQYLGKMQIEIELVTQIPRDSSGKRRRVYRAFLTS